MYSYIQSPFLIACLYPLLRRFSWLGSPRVVFPAISGVCLFFFAYYETLSGFMPGVLYDHFAFAAVFILAAYSALRRFGYSDIQSLTLAMLTMIAIDELWQTPFNVLNWTHSLSSAAVGLATAGWSLMSIPLIFAFLLRFKGRIAVPLKLLAACILLTAFETLRFAQGGFPDNLSPVPYGEVEPYYLIVLWLAFFIATFRASSSNNLDPQVKKASLLHDLFSRS